MFKVKTWQQWWQSLRVVMILVLLILMITCYDQDDDNWSFDQNLAISDSCDDLIVIILRTKLVIWCSRSKPGNNDVNLGPTGAKDASSLLHSNPAKAETKIEKFMEEQKMKLSEVWTVLTKKKLWSREGWDRNRNFIPQQRINFHGGAKSREWWDKKWQFH